MSDPDITVTTFEADRAAKSGFAILLTLGLLTMAIGAALLFWPDATVKVVAVLFGIWLFVSGIYQLVQAFTLHGDGTSRTLLAISGILSILLGAICFTSVAASVTVLVVFIVIGWLMRGIVYLVGGLQDRDDPMRGTQIFFGILLLALALITLAWPEATLRVLLWVLGLGLLVAGLFEVVAAFMVKKAASQIEGQVTVVEVSSRPLD